MDVKLLDNPVKMEEPVRLTSQLHPTIPASVLQEVQARTVKVSIFQVHNKEIYVCWESNLKTKSFESYRLPLSW